MDLSFSNALFYLLIQKALPLICLLLIAVTAPFWVRLLPPFRRMQKNLARVSEQKISIGQYCGEVRRFPNIAEANRRVIAWHKSKALQDRLNVELDDLFRTCCAWLLVHLIVLIAVAFLMAGSDLASKIGTTTDTVLTLVSLPLTEILATLFFALSLHRLAQEWRGLEVDIEG